MASKSLFIIMICLISTQLVFSKDLGVHGNTYKIIEIDLLQQIQERLSQLEKSGDLLKHNQKIVSKIKKSILTPKPVEGLVNTIEPRKYYHDPIYIAEKTIRDHLGNIIVSKGDNINVLERVPPLENMLFIDGNDNNQVQWAQSGAGMIILVSGSPMSLEKDLNRKIYFDQNGTIVRKFGIEQVPAKIVQEGTRLLIEEIKLEEDDEK